MSKSNRPSIGNMMQMGFVFNGAIFIAFWVAGYDYDRRGVAAILALVCHAYISIKLVQFYYDDDHHNRKAKERENKEQKP